MTVLRAAWDDIVSAAHAVEAAFVAIGAAIDDALDWLKWAFDFETSSSPPRPCRAIRSYPRLPSPS